MANHLLIVSGGTGGKVVRAFKKLVYQQYRNEDPNNIGYLYIDSSTDEYSKESEWEVMGESIALGTSNFLELKSDNLASKFAEIERYPGVKNFIGDQKYWLDLINDSRGQKTAGMQRRRMGRILFASNAKTFNSALAQQVLKLQQDTNETNVTFHVCAGLAGGTGSGSIVDIITQIRNNYPAYDKNYSILVYVYLPEDATTWNTELDFYYANGYAALMDLNALSAGALRPYDVTGEKGQLNVDTPFTGCYVFSNQNENGISVNKETELPSIVADFIYQKTIGLAQISSELHRLESGENGDPTPEMAVGSRTAERSKRFLSFGIKRLAIPEQEIREYLTYNLAKQAALQLRFNNWVDVAGYVNDPKPRSFNEEVRQADILHRWRLTFNHLILSEAVLIDDTSRKWKTYQTHWREKCEFFKSLARQSEKVRWIDAFKSLSLKEYEEDFRKSGGVISFFLAKRKDKRDMAIEIRRGIEGEFFGEWRSGKLSIYDLKLKLGALLDYLRTDLTRELDNKLEAQSRLLDTAKEAVRVNDENWAKIGLLSDMLGKREQIFEAQVLAIQDEYRIRTTIEGIKFGKDFIYEVVEQLELLNQEITKASATINSGLEIFDQSILSRCNDQEWTLDDESEYIEVFKQQLVPFYESMKVKEIVKRFERDDKVQEQQTAKVRETLSNILGVNRQSFVNFNSLISKSTFVNTLEKVCQENAVAFEADLGTQDRLLGMNVLEKLRYKYENNTRALRSLTSQLMRFAGCYALFNQNEINKAGDGFSAGAAKRTLFVILPKNSSVNYPTFIDELKEAFEFNKNQQSELKFLEADSSEHQITLMTVTSLFPLRYLTHTERLREKYRLRLQKSDSVKARMLVHIQDDELPDLFAPTLQEANEKLDQKRVQSITDLLMAHAMDLVKEKENENGYKKLALVEVDRFGDEEPLFYMDKMLHNAWKSLIPSEIEKLSQVVRQESVTNYRHKSKRVELVAKIEKMVVKLREEAGNPNDYNLFKDAAKRLINDLEKEN
ncbi:tubulin-like doman-containing protein [Telluribacter sp. SYSU D00476]|uniref:tubulin-like doman-containing protein n=1 Tax=Telluribacter sp. SYSU D00476 TaxID=2811430 RepID=UPI001FF3D4AD|nr:tubulin-like doman-containing protein [Telluribacter sp. SYSU D00476]